MCCYRIPEKSHVADLPIDLKLNYDDDIKQCSVTYVVLNEQVYLPTYNLQYFWLKCKYYD